MKRPPKKGSKESREARATSESERDDSPAPRRPSLKKMTSGSASDESPSPPRARAKPMARPDAGPPPPREGNQFKEMQLALDAAPLGLKVLGLTLTLTLTLHRAA